MLSASAVRHRMVHQWASATPLLNGTVATNILPSFLLLVAVFLAGCGRSVLRHELHPVYSAPPPDGKAVLKAHMKSGEMFMLTNWELADGSLSGTGVHYDKDRTDAPVGQHRIPLDSVAIFETNTPAAAYPFGASGLAVMTTVWAAVGAMCLVDPKGCFGSCPTFYTGGESDELPAAEGFSSSVVKALEARDIDALPGGLLRTGDRLLIEMRNEAMETHAVRHVRILATPRRPGSRNYAAPDGSFFATRDEVAPTSCKSPYGSCDVAVRHLDGIERTSPADSSDLAAREVIELAFPPVSGNVGVVIGARNTLLTTFLFYQSLAYLGKGIAEYMAMVERAGPEFASQIMAMATALGGIDIDVLQADGGWQRIGSFNEAGPIATDIALFPFDATVSPDTIRVRLTLAKGNWRLGYVALATLDEKVTPTVLDPVEVTRDSRRDERALASLLDSSLYLVTLPGDRYTLSFKSPGPDSNFEFFLDTQGYYYEWMRAEWLAEQDATLAAMVVLNPGELLRRLAMPYKTREPDMDRVFWESRFGRIRR